MRRHRLCPALLSAALAAVIPAALAGFSSPASAGVVIQLEHRTPTEKEPLQGTAWVEADRMRLDLGHNVVIYRADKHVLWMLDEKNGRYTEITKEQMRKVSDQMAGVMAQMQERLKEMPPEQRAMLEKMMAGRMPAAGAGAAEAKASSPRSLQKMEGSETINGFPCAQYEARRDGKREQEIWLTDWKGVGIQASDFKVFESFGEFVRAAMGPMSERLSIGLAQRYEGPEALPGVPIRTITAIGSGDMVDEIRKISRQSIPPSSFEVPPGLRKEALVEGPEAGVKGKGTGAKGAGEHDEGKGDGGGNDGGDP